MSFIGSDRMWRPALLVILSSAVLGCGSDDSSASDLGPEARDTYAKIVHASYDDAAQAAAALQAAVSAFVEAPSSARLTSARKAWLDAREPYLQTEVYRFYDGPIDNPEDGPEGFINAWPLDEVYIDYVVEDENAGIINDPSLTIDAETLESLNEAGGEKNIATGYHAIEFLLWGQDVDPDGPGARPYTDFATDGTGTAQNQDRRGTYLTTVSGLLASQLQSLVQAWAPAKSGSYRAEFEAVDASEAQRRILTGMIVLSGFETGRERLQPALDTGEQEDEHSCFSDNTHRDMIQDVQGMLNVWQGTYTRSDGTKVSGVGMADLVRGKDTKLAADVTAKIEESLALARALEPPFDREIRTDNSAGRARVEALINSLQEQEQLLEDVFRLLGLTVPAPE